MNILTLMLTESWFEFHVLFNRRNSVLDLLTSVLIYVSDHPCLSMMLTICSIVFPPSVILLVFSILYFRILPFPCICWSLLMQVLLLHWLFSPALVWPLLFNDPKLYQLLSLISHLPWTFWNCYLTFLSMVWWIAWMAMTFVRRLFDFQFRIQNCLNSLL